MVRQDMISRVAWRFPILFLASACIIGIVGCSVGRPSRATLVAESSPASVPPVQETPGDQTSRPSGQPTFVPRPTPIPTVAAATNLAQQTLDGKALAPNGWSAKGVVLTFRVSAPANEALVPQVEVAEVGQQFKGTPTTQGAPVPVKDHWADAQVTLKGLVPGQYKWQARFQDAETKQDGAWSTFANGDVAFGVVDGAPVVKDLTVTGTSHAVGNVPAVGKDDQPGLRWTVTSDPLAAIDHLVFLADHQETAPASLPANGVVLPPTARSISSTSLNNLDDGDWYLHVWAMDKAGQSSQPATVRVLMMRTPPRIDDVLFRTWVTNPLYQTAPIEFTPSRSATITVTIFPMKTTTPVRVFNLGRQAANKVVHIDWDGKDSHGQIVPPGSYRFFVDAVDDVGNRTQAMYTGLAITDKVIKISLGTQSLTAFEGNTPFLTTLVTSGGSDLPTPVGKWEIIEKASPFVFHSPYPKGSKFWYPDVTSHYAMLFDQPDADFIHDAPWRSKFGPGTNGPGVPGQVYTGSHGCVETPADVMPKLFPWTPLGTPVIISQ